MNVALLPSWVKLIVMASPPLVALVFAMASLILVAFSRLNPRVHKIAAAVSAVALIAAFILSWFDWLSGQIFTYGMISFDRISFLSWMIISMAALFVVLMSQAYMPEGHHVQAEYYPIILLCVFGLSILVAASNLVTLIIGLETAALGAYALVGILRYKPRCNEAAIKYFLMGSFALAFLIMGAAFIFGSTGSLEIADIAKQARYVMVSDAKWIFLFGSGLMLIGFGFKIAAVPFHAWAPDVYDGAPTPITAFVASAVKVAGFVALARVAAAAFGAMGDAWIYISTGLAIVTMTLGNIATIAQENIKRLLAYSSIAHVGYMLVAAPTFTSMDLKSAAPILFYLIAYSFMTIGAFAVVVALSEGEEEHNNISTLAGAGRKRPVLAAALTFFLVSLAGVPPTFGFFAKYYLFLGAVNAGFVWLVVIAVINSAVSLFFYLKPVAVMYLHEERAASADRGSPAYSTHANLIAVILICALAVAFFGIFPANLLDLILQSV